MNSPPPLNKMRILDFTRVLSGPVATMMLGDLGAEVIKVEPPNGDESRSWPPILENGMSAYFLALNRNKQSIALNLKDRRAREIVLKLAADADVVVENFTPGVAAKLGIDYDTLKTANPTIIYCAISGFGQTGPYRDKKAYDPIIQGMTGLMSITGERGWVAGKNRHSRNRSDCRQPCGDSHTGRPYPSTRNRQRAVHRHFAL
jgi:CoA:oxalate CoA-transferase